MLGLSTRYKYYIKNVKKCFTTHFVFLSLISRVGKHLECDLITLICVLTCVLTCGHCWKPNSFQQTCCLQKLCLLFLFFTNFGIFSIFSFVSPIPYTKVSLIVSTRSNYRINLSRNLRSLKSILDSLRFIVILLVIGFNLSANLRTLSHKYCVKLHLTISSTLTLAEFDTPLSLRKPFNLCHLSSISLRDQESLNPELNLNLSLFLRKTFQLRWSTGSLALLLLLILLLRCGDVEQNPGPGPGLQSREDGKHVEPSGRNKLTSDLQVISLNVRGLNDKKKVRHLVNYCHKKSNDSCDSIFMFQESYVERLDVLNYIWRGDYNVTAGTGSSKGCITLLSQQLKNLRLIQYDQRAHLVVIGKNDDRKAEYIAVNMYAPNVNNTDKLE